MSAIAQIRSYPLTWIIAVAVLIGVILSFASPYFFTAGNINNLMKQTAIVAILAAGQAVVIITAGIDLSVGSVLALSAVTIGWLIKAGVDPVLATFCGLLMGTFCGLVNGFIVTRAKIAPFIVTLGMLGIARGMALVITEGVSYQIIEPFFLVIGNSKFLGLPIPIYFVIVTYIVIHVMMHSTVFGRHIYAIGGDERVARLEGINVDLQKLKLYAQRVSRGLGCGCHDRPPGRDTAQRGPRGRTSGHCRGHHRRDQFHRWTRGRSDGVGRCIHHGDDHQWLEHPRHFVLLATSPDRHRDHRGGLD